MTSSSDAGAAGHRACIDRLETHVLRIPNAHGQESDGTFTWNSTTMVLVELSSQGVTGVGYTYASAGARTVIEDTLRECLVGSSAFDVPLAWQKMLGAIRNQGRGGVAAMAISAVDFALWDLKARLLQLSLADLLGAARTLVPVYASGGLTSSGPPELERELGGYRDEGFRAVKIKVGREPARDPERVRVARSVIGPDIDLMVDANGAYDAKLALRMADVFAREDVVWFEEPVSSDDLEGLASLRQRAPAGMRIAAGEYGYDAFYFERMLRSGSVDVLQADATRCMGVSGFLQADALCDAVPIALSSHCAPALHRAIAAASRRFLHLEYFRDHAYLEPLVFDGVAPPSGGEYRVDRDSIGLGLTLRRDALRRYAA